MHLMDDEDKLRPMPGAKYSQGDVVSLAGDGWPAWTVDGDYGEYGVMIHAQGDPTITHLAAHDDLTPYNERDPAYDEPADPEADLRESYDPGNPGDDDEDGSE